VFGSVSRRLDVGTLGFRLVRASLRTVPSRGVPISRGSNSSLVEITVFRAAISTVSRLKCRFVRQSNQPVASVRWLRSLTDATGPTLAHSVRSRDPRRRAVRRSRPFPFSPRPWARHGDCGHPPDRGDAVDTPVAVCISPCPRESNVVTTQALGL
jgi:hypothetical protein